MIDHKQLREHIIRPVLKYLGKYSEGAEELLIFTAAAESRMGHYINQVSGPALGIYQMEPFTHDSIWHDYLKHRSVLRELVSELAIPEWHPDNDIPSAHQLRGNLYYATAMTRMKYLPFDRPIPAASDIQGLAHYWKDCYNTSLGAGTVSGAIRKYMEAVR